MPESYWCISIAWSYTDSLLRITNEARWSRTKQEEGVLNVNLFLSQSQRKDLVPFWSVHPETLGRLRFNTTRKVPYLDAFHKHGKWGSMVGYIGR